MLKTPSEFLALYSEFSVFYFILSFLFLFSIKRLRLLETDLNAAGTLTHPTATGSSDLFPEILRCF